MPHASPKHYQLRTASSTTVEQLSKHLPVDTNSSQLTRTSCNRDYSPKLLQQVVERQRNAHSLTVHLARSLRIIWRQQARRRPSCSVQATPQTDFGISSRATMTCGLQAHLPLVVASPTWCWCYPLNEPCHYGQCGYPAFS